MRKFILLFFGVIALIDVDAQGGWSMQQLPNVPFKTSNNAISSAVVNDTLFVYSFFGIDTTKMWNGIHSKAFRYNTVSQIWDTIPAVPDSLGGVIASSATTIKNKIYIMGGYHVYSNGNEISSYQVHIFDPQTNTYSRGKNIPIEIDDHVQLGYKDSLIYVISGWSSSISGGNNTNAVQVYDAVNDLWYNANNMPNTSTFKVFGASGNIYNDTIYFAGGARYASNFPLVNVLRKGVIDNLNPINIIWTIDTVINNFRPYRAACVNVQNKMFWIGGSDVSYNYDGIAYNGSGGVSPNNFVTEFNGKTNKWEQYLPFNLNLMDLRGVAQVDYNAFILCGGMQSNQAVSNKVYLLSYDTTFLSSTDSVEVVNDTTNSFSNKELLKFEKYGYVYSFKHADVKSVELIDVFGRRINRVNDSSMSILGVKRGLYFLRVFFRNGSHDSIMILAE